MELALSFDDVLIKPKFSLIKSRQDVSTEVAFLGMNLKLGIISSNMDTVTHAIMANAMYDNGALGALHRFQSIEDNVNMYVTSHPDTIVSIGLGELELNRAKALYEVGARNFLIDVAHGANISVVEKTSKLRDLFKNDIKLIVGNFSNRYSIALFKHNLGEGYSVDAWKVGIGGGSACTTRVVTGCGEPTFSSILDCASVEEPIIADGGIRSSGDLAKAFAAGATMVMLGGMLAGTDEAKGKLVDAHSIPIKYDNFNVKSKKFKLYRGLASKESYDIQGKTAYWRTAEGKSFLVPYKGSIQDVLQDLEAGLRSAMSYVGATTIKEFKDQCEFLRITQAGLKENSSHGEINEQRT